jgi:hypothetical protein
MWLYSKCVFDVEFLAVDIECTFVQNEWIDLIVSLLLSLFVIEIDRFESIFAVIGGCCFAVRRGMQLGR